MPSSFPLRTVRTRLACALLGGLSLYGGAASAMSLMDAYTAALRNDPTYQSALSENAGGKEYRVLGRSNLLPNLSANYSRNRNRADVTEPNFLGTISTTHPVYDSRSANVTLRQPLFSMDAWARYKQGEAQTSFSDAQFDARTQEFVLRVVGAYIDALFAAEQVRLAEVKRDALREQKMVNERLFQKGEGTRTDMIETEARLDVAEAELLEAQDNDVNQRAALSALVGEPVEHLDQLAPGFRIAPLGDVSFEAMKQTAIDRNPEIRARSYGLETARQEVNKARAGHTPRVDLVANYAKSDSDTINTYQQESTVRSIGFQVNIPLYAGGGISASVRQAAAGFEKAKADLQDQTNKVLLDLRKQYSTVVSSVSRIRALDKAVESSQLQMVATQQSIKGGVRINLDLLNAQQQLFTNQRDLAQARYNYLLATLRLRAGAGTLNPGDVTEIAAYFR
jgi:protease secretion system outer membrane protein